MRNTAVLVKWIEEHQANPYPTKAEKQLLAYYSGMNLTQLSTWFANARRRIKKIGIKTWLEGRSTFSLDYFPASSLQRPVMPSYAGKCNWLAVHELNTYYPLDSSTCVQTCRYIYTPCMHMGALVQINAQSVCGFVIQRFGLDDKILFQHPFGFYLSVGLHGDKLHLNSRVVFYTFI